MGRTIDADKLKAWFKDWCEYDEFMSGYVCKLIDEQPTVQPQRMRGKWFRVAYAQEYKYQCSQCGGFHRAMYDFCPSCGADMREGQ